MSFLTFLTFISTFMNVAQAGHEDDVGYALEVLQDLPAEQMMTVALYTVTTTLEPTPCGKTGGYEAALWVEKTISYDNDYPTTKLGGFDYPAPSYENSEESYPEPTEEAYPDALCYGGEDPGLYESEGEGYGKPSGESYGKEYDSSHKEPYATSGYKDAYPTSTPEGHESESEEYGKPSGESYDNHEEPSATYENSYSAAEETDTPWGEEGASYGEEHGDDASYSEATPAYEGEEHGGSPVEGKPKYKGTEHGGPPEGGKPGYEGAENGGSPAEGYSEHDEEEPKSKPKMCKVKGRKN